MNNDMFKIESNIGNWLNHIVEIIPLKKSGHYKITAVDEQYGIKMRVIFYNVSFEPDPITFPETCGNKDFLIQETGIILSKNEQGQLYQVDFIKEGDNNE